MPQLDPTWFVSQVFWLLASFALLLVMMKFLVLPSIVKVMDDRQMQIDSDLKAAENLKKEAEKAIKSYEESIAKAQEKASEILKQAEDDILQVTKEGEARFFKKIKQQTDEAKSKIENAREKVFEEMEDIASGLVGKIIYKIISENVSSDTVKASVSKAIKEVL